MDYTVVSTQSDTHPDLPHIVGRHLQHPYQRPIPVKQRQLFADCLAAIPPHMPLILDSGCGTGRSTAYLAAQYPEHFVLGLDKSQHRLQRHHASPNITNYRLCQVELIDFWRLLAQANRPISHHFLLYPNPWPKPGQLRRRWHAHPVFPDLLGLGGRLEMRCNWEVYALEFAAAVNRARGADTRPAPVSETAITSPFRAFTS